jgi:hypothetical protein
VLFAPGPPAEGVTTSGFLVIGKVDAYQLRLDAYAAILSYTASELRRKCAEVPDVTFWRTSWMNVPLVPTSLSVMLQR